jgi:hypothetical protein
VNYWRERKKAKEEVLKEIAAKFPPTTGRLPPRLKLVPSGRKSPVLRYLNGSEWVVHRDGTTTPYKPKK